MKIRCANLIKNAQHLTSLTEGRARDAHDESEQPDLRRPAARRRGLGPRPLFVAVSPIRPLAASPPPPPPLLKCAKSPNEPPDMCQFRPASHPPAPQGAPSTRNPQNEATGHPVPPAQTRQNLPKP